MKTYYSAVPFCNVQVMRGPAHCEAVQFVAGRLETDDKQVIEHLDAVVDKSGSGITSTSAHYPPPEVVAMKSDLKASAEAAHAKMVAAGQSTA